MKKSTRLWIVTVAMVILTACSFGKDHEESAAQAGQEILRGQLGAESVSSDTDESAYNAAPPEHVYEADVIRYGEPSGEFSFRKDVEVTRTGYAVYYFDTSIDLAERNACIKATDQALSRIEAVLPEVEIAVLSPEFYDGVLVSGNRLYTPVTSWDSVDYIAKVLLAGYGEWSNYGMAYGYAYYLCRKTASGERENRRFFAAEVPESYDLTLLCFDTRFVPAEDVEAAKNNACLFVDEYLSSHSEKDFLELLSLSGTSSGVERANEALEAFYEGHGMESRPTKIRYQYGGVTFDYAAACEYARFYIHKDWREMYWKADENISEDFLHEDYADVKEFFECHAHQMEQYQEFFGFTQYNNDLVILFTNKLNMPPTYNGLYYPDSHTIYLSAVMSLMHEYIHSVMYGKFDWLSLWKREGSARYFEIRYNAYYFDFYEGMGKYYGDDTHAQEVFGSLGSYLGRTPDIRVDFRELAELSGYIWGHSDPNLSYDAATSFIAYLADQYGERETVEYICSDDEYHTEWGKSYEELVQDWNAYIEEKYAWYEWN